MSATAESNTGSPDGIASLERLRQVETDTDGRLREVRGKIDLTLTRMRDDSEAQIQAARTQAEEEAAAMLDRARTDADAEAARIILEAKTAIAQRAKAGPPDLTTVWPDILDALFDEFS